MTHLVVSTVFIKSHIYLYEFKFNPSFRVVSGQNQKLLKFILVLNDRDY